MRRQNQQQELAELGYCWARQALPEAIVCQLRNDLDTKLRPGSRLTVREYKKIESVLIPVIEQAQRLLPNCRPVRTLVFNKTTQTNWAVGWHQDRVIAVREKHKVEGFTNWTQKSGVWHCEPPIEILENMMFARVHLDESTVENGCLELALGSHRSGRIIKKDLPAIVARSEIETCDANAGDVLFAKALIAHRSKPSISEKSRMALRIDFSNTELSNPLEWAL